MQIVKKLAQGAFGLAAALATTSVAFADSAQAASSSGLGPIGAGLAIGIAVLGGTMSQGKAVTSMLESSARNPSAAGKLTVPFFVGLALIESLVILAFVIAIQQ